MALLGKTSINGAKFFIHNIGYKVRGGFKYELRGEYSTRIQNAWGFFKKEIFANAWVRLYHASSANTARLLRLSPSR